jgi:hypothetical protein
LIRARDGANATTNTNIDDAQAAWFHDVAAGDLHLSQCTIAEVVGAGTTLPNVTDDIDQDARTGSNDIGADQCQ